MKKIDLTNTEARFSSKSEQGQSTIDAFFLSMKYLVEKKHISPFKAYRMTAKQITDNKTGVTFVDAKGGKKTVYSNSIPSENLIYRWMTTPGNKFNEIKEVKNTRKEQSFEIEL